MMKQLTNLRNILICLFFIFSLIFAIFLYFLLGSGTVCAGKCGGDLICSDCHTMHYSQDGGVPEEPEWGKEGPYSFLLKDKDMANIETNELCLMCHDGTDPNVPSVMREMGEIPFYVPSAGSFVSSDPNHKHSLGSQDAPPGYSGVWNGGLLTCVSCHYPPSHYLPGNNYYRNLRPNPGGAIDITVTYETGDTYGGVAAIQQVVDTPIEDKYNVLNIKHRQSELSTNYGLSAWCAGCHTDFYPKKGDGNMGGSSSGDTQGSDEDTWIRHPTIGITLSEGVTNEHIDGDAEGGVGYWWSNLISSRPPHISPSQNIGTKSSSDNETGCITCHKAHGSDQTYCLIFDDPEASELEDGKRMVGNCQVCHLRGGGYYETSPHGDPDSGLSRITKWAKGECVQCHSLHVGKPYNLFTDNTNDLCFTSGCHDLTPTGGTNGYPAQEKDRAPASSGYPGYFEYFFGGTRAAGWENRVRWPGMAVFEDPNTYDNGPPERFFSPHRNDPDMPLKDSAGNGSCLNCHSPHGTENPFDMLTKTYLNIGGAGETDEPKNYELCFSCHGSDGPTKMYPESKKIADYYDESINPNTAGHSIRKSVKSASYWPPHIQKGDKLACSNCHNPHGSRGYENNNKPNARLLSDQRPGWNDLTNNIGDDSQCRRFCFGCHVPSDDPNDCSSYSSKCPEVDGIIMAPLHELPDPNMLIDHHSSTGKTSCYGSVIFSCHGNDYTSSTSYNVHHPNSHPEEYLSRLKADSPVLSAPTGFIATGGKSLVELVWDRYPRADIRGYHLYRSQIPGGPYELITSQPDNVIRYMDMDVRSEQNYYYVLTVEDIKGKKSPYSSEARATTMSLTPGQLKTLEEIKGLTAKVERDRIILTWEEIMDEMVAGYNIYRRKEGENINSVLVTPDKLVKWPIYEDKEIEKDQIYIYSVVAVDRIGNEARFPKEIRVANKELFITSVSISQGERPLRGGQEMVVTLTGSSGGSAYFTIEGLSGHIPLEEVEETGTYIGRYIIPRQIDNAQMNITCFLEDFKGNISSMIPPVPLRIDNLPPLPPTNLEAAMHPDEGISLHWRIEGEAQDTAKYRVYRSSDVKITIGSEWLIASDLPKDLFEYKDITVIPGKRYRYIITSVDEAGNESDPSNEAVVLIPPDTISPNIAGMQIVSGMDVWRIGDTITVLMAGESGGEASFSIGSKIKDILMNESPGTGKYKGQYVFKHGDESDKMQLIGQLTDPSGNSTIFDPHLKVSVVHDSEGTGPEIYGIEENSFQIGGEKGLVAGDVLEVIVRGSPGCFGVFHLGAFVEEDQTIKIDWSGFRESEWPDISGYQIHKVIGLPSALDNNTLLIRLGIGQRQYQLSDAGILDEGFNIYLAASDYNGYPRVISSPKWLIPLVETEMPGIYKGRYKVEPGDRLIQGYIFITLKDKSGRPSITFQSFRTITIDTGSRIEVQPMPSELRADSRSRSMIKIMLKDIKDHAVRGRQVGVALFTTSEYTGLVGLGSFNQADIGYMTNAFIGIDNRIEDIELYVLTTDNDGKIEVEYQAGFAAKTIIFRARDRITGDVGLGYCTSYIEAQAQVEQYLSMARMKLIGQKYNISLSANPEWLTADGLSTSRITASVTDIEGEPVKGHQVVFNISMGDGHLFQQEALTDETGLAAVTFKAGRRIGTVEIRAVDVTAHIEARAYIIQKSDAPALVSITAEPKRIPADGKSQCRLTIKVTDINGNPSRGVGLALILKEGGGEILDVNETTDYLGQAEAIYRSGNMPGIALFNLKVTSKIPTSEELEGIRWVR